MLESPIFAKSDRLARFLRFIVETTLAGQGETLKEYLVGTEVITSLLIIPVLTPLFAASSQTPLQTEGILRIRWQGRSNLYLLSDWRLRAGISAAAHSGPQPPNDTSRFPRAPFRRSDHPSH